MAKSRGKDRKAALTPGGPTPLGSGAQSFRIGAEDVASPETRDWLELRGAGEKGKMRQEEDVLLCAAQPQSGTREGGLWRET